MSKFRLKCSSWIWCGAKYQSLGPGSSCSPSGSIAGAVEPNEPYQPSTDCPRLLHPYRQTGIVPICVQASRGSICGHGIQDHWAKSGRCVMGHLGQREWNMASGLPGEGAVNLSVKARCGKFFKGDSLGLKTRNQWRC